MNYFILKKYFFYSGRFSSELRKMRNFVVIIFLNKTNKL